jgi:DNA-binding FadR family transcriptional regulator
MLEYSGLIESRRGRHGGLFVGPGPIPHVIGALRTLFLLGNRSIEQMYEARSILEVGIARLAARHISDDQLHELDQSIELMAQSDSSEGVRKANSLFHLTLAEASDNDILSAVMNALISLLNEMTPRDVHYDRDAIALRVGNHQQILDAIRRGDEDAAAAAMSEHVSAMTEQRRIRGELQLSSPPAD